VRGRAAAALAAAALGLGAAQAAAADPILPLSEVRAGMVGEARTVVRGTDIVTFPVTVLDVQRGADGPGGTLILVRAEGPLMEQTGGVALGMSGSPVYVTGADGVARVIGAISFGSGDEANVVVGVTPIEQMIDSSAGLRAQRLAAAGPRAVRRRVLVRDRAAARRIERRDPARLALYPLARWTIAGASRPLIGPLSRELGRTGIQVTAIAPRTPRPAVPLVPGASMSVLVAGGDLALGATGTVTYVDGPIVLGFGHPFLSGGRTRFLLGDAYVYETIAAPIAGASYKLAEPGALQGTVVGDRADGVTGELGPAAGIAATSSATDTDRDTSSTIRATLAPDQRTVPIIAGLVQDEPAIRVRDGIAGGTLTLRVVIRSPDIPRPFVYRNVFAAAGDVVSLASGQLPRLLSVLLQSGVANVSVSAVEVEQTLESRVRAARIVGASIAPRRVRPGGRAILRLRIQPWRASARVLRVPIRVPGDLALGPRRAALVVVPKSAEGFDPLPADLTQDIGTAAVSQAARRAAAVARADRVAARASGPRIARLVRGLRRVTDDRHDAVRLLVPGESADDPRAGVTIPVPYVIYGGRAAARVIVR
jgi:hypothetical protein